MMKSGFENKALKDIEGLLSKQTALLNSQLEAIKGQVTPEQYEELQNFVKDALSGKDVDPKTLIEKFKNIGSTD